MGFEIHVQIQNMKWLFFSGQQNRDGQPKGSGQVDLPQPVP